MEADQDNPELPSEIICSEILPRLPSKSLMRFKCVCKPWSSLIRNPSFVNAHRNFQYCRNSHTHLLLMITHIPSNEQKHQTDIVSVQINQEGISPTRATHLRRLPMSCHRWNGSNGLICLEFPYDIPVHIFNPSTRESITLPVADSPPTNYLRSDVSHWMGFSPLTNEYKVLKVDEILIGEPGPIDTPQTWSYTFQIFTIGKTSSWRQLEVGLDHHDLPFDPQNFRFQRHGCRSCACLNGAIHWMDEVKNVIVAFDLEDERFRTIPGPADIDALGERWSIAIIEAGGCVALAAETENKHARLRILKDYQKQVWVEETTTLRLEGTRIVGVMDTVELLLPTWGPWNVWATAQITQNIRPEIILPDSNDFGLLRNVFASTCEETIVPLSNK